MVRCYRKALSLRVIRNSQSVISYRVTKFDSGLLLHPHPNVPDPQTFGFVDLLSLPIWKLVRVKMWAIWSLSRCLLAAGDW